MKIIREKATGLVPYLFDSGTEVKITDKGLRKPIRALDIKPGTHEILEVAPPMVIRGGMWKYNAGWELVNPADLTVLKDHKQAALTTFAKQYLSSAMSDYSEWEAISWPLLIAEAETYQKDGTIGEYMAAEIGVKYPDAESLALVILARKDVMKSLRAGVVLVRQTKEAAIENAETIEELNDVQIASGWPGQEA
jgi:hypothetical protein